MGRLAAALMTIGLLATACGGVEEEELGVSRAGIGQGAGAKPIVVPPPAAANVVNPSAPTPSPKPTGQVNASQDPMPAQAHENGCPPGQTCNNNQK
jgi:hypothetical protein